MTKLKVVTYLFFFAIYANVSKKRGITYLKQKGKKLAHPTTECFPQTNQEHIKSQAALSAKYLPPGMLLANHKVNVSLETLKGTPI